MEGIPTSAFFLKKYIQFMIIALKYRMIIRNI